MVQRKDNYSSDDRFDRIERLERIISLLTAALLREWRERYAFNWDEPYIGRGGYDRLSYGPLNRFLDQLLSNLVEAGRRGPNEIPDLHRLAKLAEDSRSFHKRATDDLAKELHGLAYLMHAGINPAEVRGSKLLPVRIYTSEDGYKVVGPVELALKKLLRQYGIEIDDEFPAIRGSWFKKMIGRTKDAATSDEVKDSLKKLKHGVELQTLQKSQAEVNKTHAEAVKELMDAMSETENAACSIGSILILKVTKDGKSNVFTKTLTQNEMIAIEDNQAILMDPSTVLEKLSHICEADRSRSIPLNLDE